MLVVGTHARSGESLNILRHGKNDIAAVRIAAEMVNKVRDRKRLLVIQANFYSSVVPAGERFLWSQVFLGYIRKAP
jgi:hypothetical protein